jgi:hypothetical protein
MKLEDIVALEDKDLGSLFHNISQYSKILFIDVSRKAHVQERFRRVIKAVGSSKLLELRFTRGSCLDIES